MPAIDAQSELPPELCYDAMAETLAEIGKTGPNLDSDADDSDDEAVLLAMVATAL